MYPIDPSNTNAAAYSFGDALQQTMQRLNFYRNNSFSTADDPTSAPADRPPYYGPYRPGYIPGVSDGSSPVAFTGDSSAPSSPSNPGNPSTDALLRLFQASAPQVRQSPIFSNDALQRHPQLFGAINNTLVGAALVPAGREVEGAGEGVSRALQGALGVAPFMQHYQDAQQMLPIEHASALAKLFGTVADSDLARAHAAYYAARPGERLEEAQIKALAAQQKLGQPINSANGDLLGFMRPTGFVSSDQLGIPSGAARPHPQAPHTVETGNGVFQYNPDSNRYDIKVGPAKRTANDGSITPVQAIRMRNQADQQKGIALRQAENDVRRHYGLDKPDPMNPSGEWPQEALDEINSRKEQIQNDYLEKLSNLPDSASGSDDRISVIDPNGKSGSIPRSQMKQAKKQGYRVAQ